MPSEKALARQRLSKILAGIEDHFNNTLDVAVRRTEPGDIHSQPPSKGGAHVIRIEGFPLDLARLDHFLRQRAERGLGAKLEPKPLHSAEQPPLQVAHRRQRLREALSVPAKPGPILQFVYVTRQSPHSMRRLCGLFSANARIISA